MKRILKIAGFVVAGIIIFLALLLLLLFSGVFNQRIATTLSSVASQNVNGVVTLGRIDGNLLSHFILKDLSLTQDGKEVVGVKELEIRYNIWALLRNKVEVSNVKLEGVTVLLKEEADSLWNLQKLIPSSSKTEVDTVTNSVKWEVDLADVNIGNFQASIFVNDSSRRIPENLKLESALSFAFADDVMHINMRQFELMTKKPSLEIRKLSLEMEIKESIISWKNLDLALANSVIHTSGSIPFKQPFLSEVILDASPIDLSDLKDWIPLSKGKPNINLNITRQGNSSRIDLKLIEDNQRVKLTGNIARLDSLPIYDLLLKVDSLNGEFWTQKKDLKSNIKASVDILGEGFNIKENKLKVGVKLSDLKYDNYELLDCFVSLKKNKDQLYGEIKASTIFGGLDSKINVDGLFDFPVYDAVFYLNGLNLAKVLSNKKLESDINIELQARGQGFVPEEMKTDLRIKSINSVLFNKPITNFDARVSINRGDYLLQGLQLETPYIWAMVKGQGNWVKNNDLIIELKTRDIGEIAKIFGVDNVMFGGHIRGQLKGPMDSLNFTSLIDIDKFKLDTLSVDQLRAKADLQLVRGSYSGDIDAQIAGVDVPGFVVEKAQLKSHFSDKKVGADLTFTASDSLSGRVISDIDFSKELAIYVPLIEMNYRGDLWKGGSDSSYLYLGKDSIDISNINLISGDSYIKANGTFAFRGAENLKVEIQNLDMKTVPGLALLPYNISGIINASLSVLGTAQKPVMKGLVEIDQPQIESFRFNKLFTSFDYVDENLELKSYVEDSISRFMTVDVQLPMQFSFVDKFSLPGGDNPINATLNIKDLNLKPFVEIQGIDADGVLTASINVSNTIKSPKFIGSINLMRGAVKYPRFGVGYSDIEMNCELNNNSINLNSLKILSGKGKLNMDGVVEIDSLFNGQFTRVNLNLKGKDFSVFESNRLKAVINTDINLNGVPERLKFGGDLTVLRSMLNADIFIKEFSRVSDYSDRPMLVVARENMEKEEAPYQQKRDTSGRSPSDMYKNLTGQLDIKIPRNTWIKGKDMNFELAGNLKVIKEGEQIDLFGSMFVKRGFYKIYGRRFQFEEGEITLTGGKKLNPVVNFKVAYKFRDPEDVLRKLTLHVTGRAYKPEIQFYLDDLFIEEKDAISYLMFGKSMNQLGTSENAAVDNSTVDIAKSMALGQVSGVLKDAMESSLGLDVIEISGNKGWTQSSVSIGKYITNNLFLNYERTFALDKKEKVIEPEKITLEYQLLRSLFLQATNQKSNSGFDFILKWTWR